MKIYSIEEINKVFLATLEAFEDDKCDRYYENIKTMGLSLAIHTFCEQLKNGIVMLEDRKRIILALQVIENIIGFKTQKKPAEIIRQKVKESYVVFEKVYSYNKALQK